MQSQKWLTIFGFSVLGISLFTATGCNKDDGSNPDNEEELITTMVLTFSDGSGVSNSFVFEDLDGVGGSAPTIQPIILATSATYSLTVAFFDKSQAGQTRDITAEVAAESAAHLICFETLGNAPMPVIQDTDTNGKPLGLLSQVVTAAAGNGKLTVSLKHEPDKSSANPCAGGETDAEATFDVIIN